MRIAWRHDWDVSLAHARALQHEACRRLDLRDPSAAFVMPAVLAAVDVGYDRQTDLCFAGLVLWDTVACCVLAEHSHVCSANFPYVPGLLSFRELPALLPIFEKLQTAPGLVLCDAQGYAHPRRMGLASHLGVILDVPTLGWAKSRLIGAYEEPANDQGSATALMDRGEQIGWVLRSRAACRPTWVSPGHRVSMARSLQLARALLGRYRLCEAARQAHSLTRRVMLQTVGR